MVKIIAIIPARAGSKRLPNKNKLDFCGKPLIAWTIEEALKCEFINEIIISTDDWDIMEITNQYIKQDKRIRGIMRPKELAQDNTKMEDVIFHVIDQSRFNLTDTKILLLQPTSPLRTAFHISHAYQIFKERMSCTLVSVFREDDLHFKLNGAIYIFSIANLYFTKTITERGEFMGIYIMSKEDSWDINTIEDFQKAEEIMKRRIENGK